jgi:hypothetical protein
MSTLNKRVSMGINTTPPPKPVRDPKRPARTDINNRDNVKRMTDIIEKTNDNKNW